MNGKSIVVSTHSRAEAAASVANERTKVFNVSTHSRAEAAAFAVRAVMDLDKVSTHSRAEAAALNQYKQDFENQFQHTAARRRLLPT